MKRFTLHLHRLPISLLGFILLLSIPVDLSAQWQQTGGPTGGSFRTIVGTQNGILAVIGSQGLFHYEGATWKKISNFTPSQIIPFGEKLIGVAQGTTHQIEYFLSDDMGVTWNSIGIYSDFTDALSIVGESVYAIRNDTLLVSDDALASFEPLVPLTPFSAPPIGRSDFLLRGGGLFNDTVYNSVDGGHTWTALETNLPASASTGRELIGGEETFYAVVGSTKIFRSTDGEVWEALTDGLPGESLIDWIVANDQAAYVKLNVGTIYRLDGLVWKPVSVPGYAYPATLDGDRLLVPTNSGAFSLSADGSQLSSLADGLRNIPITVMGKAGSALFAGAINGIYRSLDNGYTWDLVSDHYVSSFESRGDMIFAVANGDILRSTDFGDTWVSMQTKFDQIKMARWGSTEYPLPFSGITIAPDGTLYITLANSFGEHGVSGWRDGGVFRSIDNGNTWQDVSGGLPHDGFTYVPVNDAIALEEGVVVISTLDGIYRSGNNGLGWSKTSGGLPTDDVQKTVGSFFRLNGDVYLRTSQGLYESNGSVSSAWKAVPSLPLEGQYWTTSGDEANIIDGKLYVSIASWDGVSVTYLTYTFDGTNWEDISSTIPAGVILQAFIQKGDFAFAGSQGHSVWVKSLESSSVAEPAAVVGSLHITPNPFVGELTLSVDLEHSIETGRIVLTNVLGEQVGMLYEGRMNVGENHFRFNGADLPSGPYFLQIEVDGKTIGQFAIKQ